MRNVSAAGAVLVLASAFLLAGCTEPTGPGPSSTNPSNSSSPVTSSATGPPAQPIHLFFDFGGEKAGPGDLYGWTARADVPADPNNGGAPVAWNVTPCDAMGWEDHVHIQYHPVHSACFHLDGRQDDGTVWISRSIPVQRGVSYQANVSVRAFGEESFNTVADMVLRLGSQPAQVEGDFAPAQDTNHSSIRRPLDMASGWTLYGMTWDPGSLATDELFLELGISAVWETEMTRYLDALTVDLQPQG